MLLKGMAQENGWLTVFNDAEWGATAIKKSQIYKKLVTANSFFTGIMTNQISSELKITACIFSPKYRTISSKHSTNTSISYPAKPSFF